MSEYNKPEIALAIGLIISSLINLFLAKNYFVFNNTVSTVFRFTNKITERQKNFYVQAEFLSL